MIARSSRYASGFAIVAALFLSSIATAQTRPTPTASDASEAKRHFDAGLRLYGERAFQEALAEFQLSYRLGGRVSALKNIAQCHRDLKHFADAYSAYEAMLTTHAAQLKPDEQATVKRTLEELSILTATLAITSNEAGAAIDVDGNAIGTTPLAAPHRIALGSHTVHVTKAGFEPFVKEVAASSEQKIELDVQLAPEITSGRVSVREQDGDEVDVIIDGENKGPAPWEGDLMPGDHILETKGRKFSAEKRLFSVARKQRLDLVIDATTTLGHLRITTSPASAAIAIDGKSVGTGVWDGDVAVGPHHVEVSAPGAPTAVREVIVARGQTFVQEIPLVAPSASTGAEYRGLYTRLSPTFLFNPTATHIAASTPSDQPTLGGETIQKGLAIGVGGTLRVGYTFDVVALEAVALVAVTHFSDGQSFAASGSPAINLDVTTIYTAFGVGPRVTSRDPGVRFTAGAQIGATVRAVNFNRNCKDSCPSQSSGSNGGGGNNNNNEFNANPGYVAPALMFDGGMLLGSTPGAKLFLGVQAVVDFPKHVEVGPDKSVNDGGTSTIGDGYFASPGRGYLIVSGPQVFIGPVIGFQFGH